MVTVQPSGLRFPVRDGEVLMRAAQRLGLKWPTVCQGHGRCGVCRTNIVSTEAELPPATPREQATLQRIPPALRNGDTRLACQLRVAGAMVVERDGVTTTAGAR